MGFGKASKNRSLIWYYKEGETSLCTKYAPGLFIFDPHIHYKGAKWSCGKKKEEDKRMAPPRKPINHLTNKSNEEINRLKRRKISKNEMKRGVSTIDLSSWGCCSTTTVVAVRRGDGGRKGQMHTLFGRPHPSSQVARRLIAVVINLSEAISSSSSSFSGGSESSFLLSSSREREEQMDLAPSFSAMATGRARARYCGSRV